MILFLDDDKYRTAKFRSTVPSAFTAETAGEMIALLKKSEVVKHLFLDHDLGNEQFVSSEIENCGMEVVRWIVANKPNIEHIVVHSLNGYAAEEMKAKLKDAGYDVERIPFIRFDWDRIGKLVEF
jgi:uroporphyrinogen-III synthase